MSISWQFLDSDLTFYFQVVPDVRRDDDMDIRQYVWFKKVPTGDKPECQVISGVVFPKNVVHKKMNCSFTQPKILMLSCAIEYQVSCILVEYYIFNVNNNANN